MQTPWYIKLFIPESIPLAPGASGEWVYGTLGIPVLGVEIMHDSSLFDRLPMSIQGLLDAQTRGIVFLVVEMIHDTIRAGTKEEVEICLNSESEKSPHTAKVV